MLYRTVQTDRQAGRQADSCMSDNSTQYRYPLSLNLYDKCSMIVPQTRPKMTLLSAEQQEETVSDNTAKEGRVHRIAKRDTLG